ncbi:MAG: alpha-amylase, partial [Hyphomicrobium sp.]
PLPAGVMGGHMIPAGAVMTVYSGMLMHMEDNYDGKTKLTPAQIATMRNRFSPPHAATYRVVPTSMDMQMQMFGAMLGLTDTFNLMIMGSHVRKEMETVTFRGMAGTTVLGTSSSVTEGMGDAAVVGLVRLHQDGVHKLHMNLGLSLPLGSTTERGRMLAPNGNTMEMRAGYGMQLGTGTVDALPGLTYTGKSGPLSWGLAYRGRLPLETSDEGWKFGDMHELNGWLGYTVSPGITATGRVSGSTQGAIHGIDPQIQGAVHTLDPDNYGGERVELLGGVEIHGMPLGLGATRLAIEAGVPVYQNLNGPQLGRDWMGTLTVGARF